MASNDWFRVCPQSASIRVNTVRSLDSDGSGGESTAMSPRQHTETPLEVLHLYDRERNMLSLSFSSGPPMSLGVHRSLDETHKRHMNRSILIDNLAPSNCTLNQCKRQWPTRGSCERGGIKRGKNAKKKVTNSSRSHGCNHTCGGKNK